MSTLFLGVIASIAMTILRPIDSNIADALDWLFMLLPVYALAQGITNIHENFMLNKNRKLLDKKELETFSELLSVEHTNYFAIETPGVGKNIIVMFLAALSILLILVAIEFKLFTKVSSCIKRSVVERRLQGKTSYSTGMTCRLNELALSNVLKKKDFLLGISQFIRKKFRHNTNSMVTN